MPVLDQKAIGQDCDDDHHTKVVDRQGKNGNDTSAVFSNIPIGSAVAVQHEDVRPWTHGTVVGTGNHSHHGRLYVIKLTNNGRCISRNRWHIKPTTVTADTYLQHQSNKQSNKPTDPLAEILDNINRNPAMYATEQARNINNSYEQYNGQNANKSVQREANIEQYNKKTDSSQERGTGDTHKKGLHYKKMKSIGQDLDAMSENQTGSHIYNHNNILADMSATPQISYGQCHYFIILSLFLYNILPAG